MLMSHAASLFWPDGPSAQDNFTVIAVEDGISLVEALDGTFSLSSYTKKSTDEWLNFVG
jgi:hypothetical protein